MGYLDCKAEGVPGYLDCKAEGTPGYLDCNVEKEVVGPVFRFKIAYSPDSEGVFLVFKSVELF